MDRAPAHGSLSDPRDSHAVYLCEYSRINL
jgi:hypothetical protein